MTVTLKATIDPDAAMIASGPPDETKATPAEMARWGRLVGPVSYTHLRAHET